MLKLPSVTLGTVPCAGTNAVKRDGRTGVPLERSLERQAADSVPFPHRPWVWNVNDANGQVQACAASRLRIRSANRGLRLSRAACESEISRSR